MKLRIVLVAVLSTMLIACATAQVSSSPWTKLVQVEGQPELVPEQWVSTPEGKFAHSIKIPNPVPKDSGYKPGMSSEEYFKHLCEKEAGEFIFKTVDNVEGFYFMRPPKRPTDAQLKDRWALEAPEIERTFQLLREVTEDRSGIFIAPPFNVFQYVEEPHKDSNGMSFLRASGFRGGVSKMKVEQVNELRSRYGLIWRGITRESDRRHGISGGEWIVVELRSNEVLGVMRNYGLTGRTRNTPDGIWWLNAVSCPMFAKYKFPTSEKIYDFTSTVLKPISGGKQ